MKAKELLDKVEMLQFFNQRAGRELWGDKPTEVQNIDIKNADKVFEAVKGTVIKSIPMKLKEVKTSAWWNESYKCPSCDNTVVGSKESLEFFWSKGRYHFCDYCGQALDMEE